MMVNQRFQLIAIGRSHWRGKIGDPFRFVVKRLMGAQHVESTITCAQPIEMV